MLVSCYENKGKFVQQACKICILKHSRLSRLYTEYTDREYKINKKVFSLPL